MNYAQSFCQVKSLIKTHTRGKNHHYSICGCQFRNFQTFLYQLSIHKLPFFQGSRHLIPPSMVQSWRVFSPGSIQIDKKQHSTNRHSTLVRLRPPFLPADDRN